MGRGGAGRGKEMGLGQSRERSCWAPPAPRTISWVCYWGRKSSRPSLKTSITLRQGLHSEGFIKNSRNN